MGIVDDAHNLKTLGTGDKTVVLAHGFGTDQSVWRHLVPHLVDGFRVVLYDNMGAGTTNPDYYDFDRYSTLEGYALDLLAILTEIEVDSCIFVGHSLSAMTWALASITRPELFDKLIMITPSPRFLNDADYYEGFEQEDIDQLLQAVQSNYKRWCSRFAPLLVGGDMASSAVQEFGRTLFNMRPAITLNTVKTIFQYDFRPLLRYVSVPCHIIHSQKDMAVPVQVSEYVGRHLGGKSIVEVMPVEGHLPQLTSPEIVISVLLRHIQCDLIA